MTKTSTLKWFVAFSLSLVNFIALADEISLIDNNGIYMVPITLNGTVNVAGILDTGASEMFLPFNVIATLIQSGSINSKDILKSGTYTLADGTVKTRERVNIEKIKIGNNSVAWNLYEVVEWADARKRARTSITCTAEQYKSKGSF